MMIGRLIKKIQCQEKVSVRIPPKVGPIAAAPPCMRPRAATILKRSLTSQEEIPKLLPTGSKIAAPKLEMIRPRIN